MFGYLRDNKGFTIALLVFIGILIFGFVVPNFLVDPFQPITSPWGTRILEPPSEILLLGTNDFGHDIFSQLATATRNSLIIGIITAIIVVTIALVIGSVAAYKGGVIDEFLMLITNIVIVFPVYPVLLILAASISSSQRTLVLVAGIIAITNWPWVARAIRSQVLTLKQREFVNLSRVSGMHDIKIAATEVLPNMFAYISLLLAIVIGISIVAEAGISMIGLGPPYGRSESLTLGVMLYWVTQNEAIRSNSGYYWLFYPPGIILTMFLVILYVIHGNLDEIFNPRLKRR